MDEVVPQDLQLVRHAYAGPRQIGVLMVQIVHCIQLQKLCQSNVLSAKRVAELRLACKTRHPCWQKLRVLDNTNPWSGPTAHQ